MPLRTLPQYRLMPLLPMPFCLDRTVCCRYRSQASVPKRLSHYRNSLRMSSPLQGPVGVRFLAVACLPSSFVSRVVTYESRLLIDAIDIFRAGARTARFDSGTVLSRIAVTRDRVGFQLT